MSRDKDSGNRDKNCGEKEIKTRRSANLVFQFGISFCFIARVDISIRSTHVNWRL